MTVDASTIPSDVQDGFDVDADDGANAFLSSLIGEDPSKKKPSTETPDKATETPQDETGEETGENTEGDKPESAEADPDDAEVEIKVGEETKKATLKELKRLYGQEASLTQKSQQLAEARRIADATHTRANTALTKLLDKAVDRFKPYQEMDWLVLSQRMNTEDFQALRNDATAAQSDLTFLQSELDGVVAQQRTENEATTKQAAIECVRVLTSPETGIKDFGPPMYQEMLKFATDNGVQGAHTLVQPAALKILHMAMMYAKSQKQAAEASKKVERAVNQATRVLRPNTSSTPTTQASGRQKEAMRNLRNSGSVDDAANAFMASFQNND